ncbi:hypothetical protein [Sorangium sp. So ce388]|uniref:hypothetical protein n=1 Tax=Sorangium sp. So ce388 TaxID=3133309 RepID=UPI003F5B6CB1
MEAPREDHPPAGGCAPAGAGVEIHEPAGPDASDLGPDPEIPGSLPTEPRAGLAPTPAAPPAFTLEPPAPPPAKAARRRSAAPRTAAPDDGVSKSLRRYAEAYARGQRAATGEPFAPPTDSHAEYLFRKVLPVYAVDADGQRLEGDALDVWIEASSAEYRRATSSQAQYQGGFHPRKWAEWLGAGKPRASAPGGRVVQFQGGRTDPDERAAHQRKRAAELELHLERDSI